MITISRKKSGFTLIELLVVIADHSYFGCNPFPSFRKSKRGSKEIFVPE